MKTLDLYRIWEILNIVHDQENILSEKGIYPDILGHNSIYIGIGFESFLANYSFRVDADQICIFNDDPIPYENYTNNDFSYIPEKLLYFNDKELMDWIEQETKIRIAELEEDNKNKRKQLEDKIQMLTNELNNLIFNEELRKP